MYVKSFTLPIDEEEGLIGRRMLANGGYIDNAYPCRLFSEKGFREVDFADITIFYGGNGSGKSTLLNLIASKLELNRIAPFNSSELFDDYVERCTFAMDYDDEGFIHRIPDKSRIITSDDIFDYMLCVRTNNAEIAEEAVRGKDEHRNLKYGDTVKFCGMEDFEAVRMQVLARRKSVSRRQFIRRTAGTEVRLGSNGETALTYFEEKLKPERLYCLDEPENSMSPKMQLELLEMLSEMVSVCSCQFIIATHSPFLLSLEGTRIYDLDADPVDIKDWWGLENVRETYRFFARHRHLFKDLG